MSEEYPKNERCFALLGAIQCFQGMTRAQARKIIPAYSFYRSEETFRRTFERDIAALRAYGYPIREENYTYFYDADAAVTSSLSSLDIGLLASALTQVDKGKHSRGKTSLLRAAKSGIAKLLADNFSAEHSPRYLKTFIPNGEEAPAIAAALQARRRISFEYRTPVPRHYEMEPSHLSVHFGNFYVTGWAHPLGESVQETGKASETVLLLSADSRTTDQWTASHQTEQSGPHLSFPEEATAQIRAHGEINIDLYEEIVTSEREEGREETDIPWKKRTFRISRIVSGSIKNVGEALLAPPDIDTSAFLAPQAVVAVKPGFRAAFLAHATPCSSTEDTPEGWTCVQLTSVNRHHLFEFLIEYSHSVRLVGNTGLLNEWRTRIRHLACLKEKS